MQFPNSLLAEYMLGAKYSWHSSLGEIHTNIMIVHCIGSMLIIQINYNNYCRQCLILQHNSCYAYQFNVNSYFFYIYEDVFEDSMLVLLFILHWIVYTYWMTEFRSSSIPTVTSDWRVWTMNGTACHTKYILQSKFHPKHLNYVFSVTSYC